MVKEKDSKNKKYDFDIYEECKNKFRKLIESYIEDNKEYGNDYEKYSKYLQTNASNMILDCAYTLYLSGINWCPDAFLEIQSIFDEEYGYLSEVWHRKKNGVYGDIFHEIIFSFENYYFAFKYMGKMLEKS